MNISDPPKNLLRLFRWFCHPDLRPFVEGDLIEIFQHHVKTKGKRKANWLFAKEVGKLVRPSLIKNLEGFKRLNNYGMFKNYLKTSIRSLKNNLLFSTINVFGLGISMSVGILMILLLTELNSFDQFHEKKESLYRITSSSKIHEMELALSTASHFIGEQLANQVTGVDEVLIMRPGISTNLELRGGPISLTGYYATQNFFDVFSFQLLEGNPNTALVEPNSIVLTQTLANKIFPNVNPIGKALVLESDGGWQQRTIQGKVTGVVEDPPTNSHLQFESLVSLSTYDQPAEGNGWNPSFRTNQKAFQQSFVYVVLNEDTQPVAIEEAMADIMADYNQKEENPIIHGIQPLDEFVTSDKYINRSGASFSKKRISIMLGLTAIVLLSACFNYTNLSLARALRRAKEVGVRKVNGASRLHLLLQFMIEATLLSLISFTVGVGLFFVIRPGFLALPNPAANGFSMFELDIAPIHLLYFLFFAIMIGILAGILPAIFLSKLKAGTVFNDASKIKLFSGLSLRRILIVFQFALSIGLIMCAFLINKQYQFALNYDPGYETENIFNISIHGDYIDLLETEYKKLPAVVATAKASTVLGYGSGEMGMAHSEDKSHTGMALINAIDENYLTMHGFELIAGNYFEQPLSEGQEPDQVILNKSFLSLLQMGSPQEAIGKHIFFRNARFRVIGVVEDFITYSLNLSFSNAFGFVQHATEGIYEARNLGVEIHTDDLLTTIGDLEGIYRKLDPLHPFDGSFHTDAIAKSYESEKTTFTIISFLAFLAISISTLGLLGMAVFTTETRMKEISIRKVLGAGIANLTMLLSRSFIIMIGIAAILSIPSTKYIVDEIILNEFLYRANFNIADLLSGLFVVFLFSLLIIGWQIRQAAIQNPSDLLRDE
ncbi:ABC transporter permease [Ekhidna sp.]